MALDSTVRLVASGTLPSGRLLSQASPSNIDSFVTVSVPQTGLVSTTELSSSLYGSTRRKGRQGELQQQPPLAESCSSYGLALAIFRLLRAPTNPARSTSSARLLQPVDGPGLSAELPYPAMLSGGARPLLLSSLILSSPHVWETLGTPGRSTSAPYSIRPCCAFLPRGS
jgi:hypothetical protein